MKVEICVRFNTGKIVKDFVVHDKVTYKRLSSSVTNSRALSLSKYDG